MRTVDWHKGRVRMIDQRELPWQTIFVEYSDHAEVARAITDMVVRGAPAIGATGAFGMALAGQQAPINDAAAFKAYLVAAADLLKHARPTAVNLSWGVDRLLRVAELSLSNGQSLTETQQALIDEACRVADEDVAINQRMGNYGATLIQDGDVVLHHCNTGALATVDYGTALGVIRAAHEQGKRFHVLLDETRPRMQGARLSAWELKQLGIPFEIIPDSAAGHYMQRGEVKLVLVGADRVAANGDSCNKVGTYMLSVLAHENGVPFYVVSPTSTIDLNIQRGADIPIEERSADELRKPYGHALVPDDYPVRNPAFDVAPHKYVSGIVTEGGIVRAPYMETLAAMVRQQQAGATQ